jgi:hypothetical protein
LQREGRRFLPVGVGYVFRVVIGLFVARVAVALYFGLAVHLVVPFRDVT